MVNEFFIKGLAKNPKELAKWSGFEMSKEEVRKLWDKGLVPERVYKEFLNKYESSKKTHLHTGG